MEGMETVGSQYEVGGNTEWSKSRRLIPVPNLLPGSLRRCFGHVSRKGFYWLGN